MTTGRARPIVVLVVANAVAAVWWNRAGGARHPRVFLIAIDGADPAMLDRLIAAGTLGQSTILTLSVDRATGEVYCMTHHLTVDSTKRTLMIAALRYADTYVKQDGVWLYAERRLYVDWIEERPLS